MRQALTVWLAHFVVFALFAGATVHSPLAFAFALCAVFFQASLLSLPMFGLAHLSTLDLEARWTLSIKISLYILGLALLILLFANYTLNSMYGFFIDSFVLNLMTTPGGTAALGASKSTYFTVGCISGSIVSLYVLVINIVPVERLFQWIMGRQKMIALSLVAVFLGQAIMYAVSDFKSYTPILITADRIAWYQPVTSKSFLKRIGVERSRTVWTKSKSFADSEFAYPRLPTKPAALDQPFNIVWLTAESWRADMLNAETMPYTYNFAQDNQHFLRHYSTGNGTRMGIFGQFYGLSGRFWFPALKYQRGPLMLDFLQSAGYDFRAFTSANFTYPEFEKTVWLKIPKEQLHSDQKGPSWQRDERNVSRLIEFMESARDPFFEFLFFESTHANYTFPEDKALLQDYIDDFDYLATDITGSIEKIKNRYINASHFLDGQFQRVIESLERQEKLDSTIVVITGDHGEEFMENGRWGHNSTFSNPQIRVPLVIHMPQKSPRQFTAMTSHLDLPATIMSAVGAKDFEESFTMGQDLLIENYIKDYAIVSDWHGDAIVTNNYKFSLSDKANTRNKSLSYSDDASVNAAKDLPAEIASALGGFISDSSRFRR